MPAFQAGDASSILATRSFKNLFQGANFYIL